MRHMRIAQVAPLYESVPPKGYGGTERVVSWLTEELVRLGHEVTLFASADSMTTARLVPCCAQSLRLSSNCIDQLAHHVVLLEKVLREKDEFDLIHFHTDYFHFPVSSRERYAHVTTLHGRLDIPDLAPLYGIFSEMPVISISDAQRDPLPDLNWQGTVHHGFPPESYSAYSQPGKYLAFLGRTSPEKGLDQAIEIAQRAGMPLKIAAKIDKVDQEYFDAYICPLLNSPGVEFLGEIGYPEKNKFLGEAAALLFPISWPEPFGIVMIEAMACGTPVIAYPFGSIPEVVKEGVSGHIVPDLQGAVDAMGRVVALDRKKVRKYFEQRFTASRMTQDYLRIYERLISQGVVTEKKSPLTVHDGVLNWMKLTSPSSTT
jgi:glycosyltransferase involved in cell wall biosynthesis